MAIYELGEERRRNNMNAFLQAMQMRSQLEQQKIQSAQSRENALINAGYIPNQQASAKNAFQRFLGMGGGNKVVAPDPSQIDPNSAPQLAGYSYVGRPVYQMVVDPTTGQQTMVNVGNVAKNAIVKGAQAQAPQYGDYSIDTSTPEGKQAFLESVPPQQRNVVRAIAENNADVKQVASIRGKERTAILNAAMEVNPDFDMTDFQKKQKFATDWTSGKAAKNIVSINTAIGHIDTLDGLFSALGNGDIQAVNAGLNMLKEQTGNPSITSTETAIEAVTGELANTFKQTGATNQEIESWQRKIKRNISQGQWEAARQTTLDLLSSRVGAYSGVFKDAMKKDMTPQDVLNEKSMGVMTKFGFSPEGIISGKKSGSSGGMQTFQVNGKIYTIPSELVADFKKDMGL